MTAHAHASSNSPTAPPLQGLPSLKALHAFEAAARHLNFRLAAEELDVTQGAVAQQVRALEAELGIRLFERHARGLARIRRRARCWRRLELAALQARRT